MRISIEWFLIDNVLMNRLVLELASAMSGIPLRKNLSWMFALFGSICALFSMLYFPWLLTAAGKILLCIFMAFPMVYTAKDFLIAVAALLAAACLMGGLQLCLCYLFGGSFYQGVLIGTMPMRIALIGGLFGSMFPRTIRSMNCKIRLTQMHVPLRIQYKKREVQMVALIDSGNLLLEPISKKPVIVVKLGCLATPLTGKRPISYCSVGGEGILFADDADQIQIYLNEQWHFIDAMIAESEVPFGQEDAIIPMALIPNERIGQNANTKSNPRMLTAMVQAFAYAERWRNTIYTFGRNIAGTVSGRRGTGVDQTVDDGRTGSKECAD